jgi:hypothetical protein
MQWRYVRIYMRQRVTEHALREIADLLEINNHNPTYY